MIIGVCGFGSTGSSAVSDLLHEFDENQILDDHEFILPYFPDALLDLDLHINKYNVKYYSYVAIDRFRRFAKDYCKIFENEKSKRSFLDISEEYIEHIVQVSWKGTSNADWIALHQPLKKYIGYSVMMGRVFPFIEKKTKSPVDLYPIHKMSLSVSPDQFYYFTKQYLNDVLANMGADFGRNIVLDQPFPGNNPSLCFKYFDNPKAIVVDRDPRDQYLFAKKFLLRNGRYIPSSDVQSFIVYYRSLREKLNRTKEDINNVMYLRFEDMVYDYESVKNRIMKFCELKQHSKPKSIFDPKLSINNTQVFRRYPELMEDIKVIERELKDFLYPFENYNDLPDESGEMFYGKSPLNKK